MTEEKLDARRSLQASYFCVRLYVETESYDPAQVLSNLDSFDQWAYILHDKDTNEDGELKKAHYHVVLRNLNDDGKPSATTIGHVASVLGISPQDIQAGQNENEARGFKGAIKYLIHNTKASEKKYQYSRDEIKANFNLDKIFGENFSMAKQIIDYIMTYKPPTFSALCVWCIENNCWSELRRSQYAFKTIMEEVKRHEV